jgi:cell division transport system permease protein
MGMFFRLVFRGVRDLFRHPWPQALTLAAVTLTAFLGGLFAMFLHNLEAELVRHQGKAQYQIFWKKDAPEALVAAQWADLRTRPELAELVAFTPDQALTVMQETLGAGADLSWLRGKSPLPYTALATFRIPPEDADWPKRTFEALKSLEGVATVHVNPLQMDLSRSVLELGRTLLWPTGVFLLLLVALVVGNTVKLSLLARADEVSILRLVGAKNWYIRLPFLVGGGTLGLVGAGLALALLKVLQQSLAEVLNVPPLWINIAYLPLPHAAALAGTMVLVAVAASWVAARDRG